MRDRNGDMRRGLPGGARLKGYEERQAGRMSRKYVSIYLMFMYLNYDSYN
jgi:hypothetical protein